MALPADYQTGTITGRWVGLDGVPMQGTVTFEAQVPRMTSTATNTIVVPFKVVATLNVNGEISQALPATDDPHISPVDFTYKVTESFNQGQSRSYHILVPHSTTTDLADVVSISANTGVTITKGDPGPALTPKGSVANAAALPGSGNTEGDLYVTEDTHTFYAWNGSGWVDLGEIGPTDGSAATPSLRTLGTGSTQAAQGSALAALTTTVAGKEDAGVAASLIAAEDELDDGESTKLDTSVSGFVSINRKVLAFDSKITSFTSTTTETSLLNSTLALPTTWTVDTRYMNIRLTGVHTNNTGSSNGVTIKVKVGATAVWTFAFTGLSTSATDRPYFIDITARVVEFVPGTCLLVGVARGAIGAPGGGTTALDLVVPTATTTFAPGASISLNVTGTHSSASASQATLLAVSSHVALAVI